MTAFIDDHRGAYGVEPICKVLPIAPSTYYEQAARRTDPARAPARVRRDAELREVIGRIWAENFEAYGARKVWRHLVRDGLPVARCTVARLMRGMGLKGVVRGKSIRTTRSDRATPCPLDRVNRQFRAARPNQLWVSDFTYVSTWQGSIPSASLEESIGISKEVAALVKQKFPEVETTLAMIGRAEKGETADVNYMEIYTPLKPKDQWRDGQTLETIEEAMQKELTAALPTAVVSYTQPIQMRIEELISGVRATLALKIYGDDLGKLDRLSEKIKDVLAGVPGVADLALEANIGKPQIRIQVDRNALARYGLNADDVLTVVKNGIGGETVSTLLDGVKRFDITVRLDKDDKASLQAIERIPLRTPNGAIVRLAQVAKVSDAEGYSFIRREQLQRYAVIQMDVRGRDIDGFVKDANARIAQQVKLPTGYYTEWGGAFENQQRALARLSLIVPVTIFFIFVLLYTAFNSVKYAALILANVPFAIIGGILGLAITGQYLSVPSAIGFIAVFGVAMLNGIVLVSFLNQQREKGLAVRDAVIRGTALRLRPVLMTASVAILGLVPMLLSSGVGAETQRPLATVVVGGLITSTLLTLVLLPVLYDWIEERAARRLAQQENPS